MLKDLLIISSTQDIHAHGFIVPVLTGTIPELGSKAAAMGFDGLEFMPNPDDVPDARATELALAAEGCKVSVVNSGRVQAQGYALLHRDAAVRRESAVVFKRLIDFAGALGARVGLGMARGFGDATAKEPELTDLMMSVFGDLADHATAAGTIIMLEPADAGIVAAVGNMTEAVKVARSLNTPSFSVMLDSLELQDVENSISAGILAASGLPDHIQLYDPGHMPPGVLPADQRLNWEELTTALRTSGFNGTASVLPDPSGDVDASAAISNEFIRRAFSGQTAVR